MNFRRKTLLVAAALALVVCSCQTKTEKQKTMDQTTISQTSVAKDTHSYANPEAVAVKHLDLNIEVSFEQKTIKGTATYDLDKKTQTNTLILDARDLKILKVTDAQNQKELAFKLGEAKPVFGQPLQIELLPETKRIAITYETSPEAAALQWLNPQQTAGKKYPFLFTQSQAILARTWLPCQDSPGVRFTYNATVKVPTEMLALMSAVNPQQKTADGV